MIQIKEIWSKVFVLAIVGGIAFWVANFAISLTPIAAEYRAALSISYFPMLLESLLGGLMIGFCVSYFLLRFFDKIPTNNPIIKSIILSLIVLIIVTILIGGPSSFLTPGDPLRYFLIGTIFNVLRILALGIAIGYLYSRMHKGFDPSAVTRKKISPARGRSMT
jgi:NhaP-type Na+/H+ or K+/H+ antiporter